VADVADWPADFVESLIVIDRAFRSAVDDQAERSTQSGS
jgi:hypothetical protein